MYPGYLRPAIGHLQQILRMEQRLTIAEFYQLPQLSEAILSLLQMGKSSVGVAQ
jgi:hypothetical protein